MHKAQVENDVVGNLRCSPPTTIRNLFSLFLLFPFHEFRSTQN